MSTSGNPQFATTQWSMVVEAGQTSSPESRRALASLCEIYWYPLYAYARRRGTAASDAKDLTQAFFLQLLEKKSLHAADPERGRFRAFLLTAFKNFLSKQHEKRLAQKRGGGVPHVSMNFDLGEERYQVEPVDTRTAERLYERRWALTLLEHVMERLRGEYAAAGKTQLFDSCKGHLTGAGPGYSEAASQLQMTTGALRVAVHRMRARYRELLESEVSATLADSDSIKDELNYLRRAIRCD